MLHLTLSLPDGGSSLIPVAWTDLSAALPFQKAERGTRVLGTVRHLIRTRSVVDALLQRVDASYACPPSEEDPHATRAISVVNRNTAEPTDLGLPQRRAANNNHNQFGISVPLFLEYRAKLYASVAENQTLLGQEQIDAILSALAF